MRAAHRRAHRLLWLTLAVVLPAILLLALGQRDTAPGQAPQRIEAPR